MHFTFSHNQKKDNNKFKNNKQLELPEDQTLLQSDNHGVKEETFIQTGRRGGDRQPGWRGHTARQWLVDRVCKATIADWAVPHSCMDKLGGSIQNKTHCTIQGSIVGKIIPQNFWL